MTSMTRLPLIALVAALPALPAAALTPEELWARWQEQAQGFGLTLTEAMWKARPVVASAVGGLQDQMTDGVEGFLLRDAADLDAFGSLVTRILDEPELAATMGRRGQERVRRDFLGDRHLVQWVQLLTSLRP